LIQDHKIPPHIEYRIKDILDKLASLRATDNKLAFEHIHTVLLDALKEAELNDKQIDVWVRIIRSKYLDSTQLKELAKGAIPNELIEDMVEVLEFFEAMNKHVYCDLTVIRSQEYYTGITFQADILLKHHYINEVAGGGRYDEFVGKFLKRVGVKNKGSIAGTGFALSLERLVHAWELNEKEFEGNIYFFTSINNVDYVIHSEDKVNGFNVAESYRTKNKRTEVYITKRTKQAARQYAKKINAELIEV
jgi:histidyl-tRNA synthetase